MMASVGFVFGGIPQPLVNIGIYRNQHHEALIISNGVGCIKVQVFAGVRVEYQRKSKGQLFNGRLILLWGVQFDF